MTTNEKRIYEKALETFGRDSQMHMCSEEMSELNKVLMKIFRNGFKSQRENLIDELADVKVVVPQIEYIFGISAEVEKRRQEKLDRLVNLLASMGVLVNLDGVYTSSVEQQKTRTYDVRVKILRCNVDAYWYADKIGHVFECTRYSEGGYQCDLPDGSFGLIDESDCVEMAQ